MRKPICENMPVRSYPVSSSSSQYDEQPGLCVNDYSRLLCLCIITWTVRHIPFSNRYTCNKNRIDIALTLLCPVSCGVCTFPLFFPIARFFAEDPGRRSCLPWANLPQQFLVIGSSTSQGGWFGPYNHPALTRMLTCQTIESRTSAKGRNGTEEFETSTPSLGFTIF